MKRLLCAVLALVVFATIPASAVGPASVRSIWAQIYGGSSGGTFTGGTLTENLTMSDGTVIELATGTPITPALRLRGDTDTYIYSPVSNSWEFQAGGNRYLLLEATLNNVYAGKDAGVGNTGSGNIAIGDSAMKRVYTNCIAIGANALGQAGGSSQNVIAMGTSAGGHQTGWYNIYLGAICAQYKAISGDRNTFIGYSAATSASQTVAVYNTVAIGPGVYTTASNQVVIGSSTITDFQLGQDGVLGRFRPSIAELPGGLNLASTTAKIGIGTDTPDCALQNQGFSRLGELSPKLKCKQLTIVTDSVAGGAATASHGLNYLKIRAIDGIAQNDFGAVPPNIIPKEQSYSLYADGQNVIAVTGASATSMLGKTVYVTIFYTE